MLLKNLQQGTRLRLVDSDDVLAVQSHSAVFQATFVSPVCGGRARWLDWELNVHPLTHEEMAASVARSNQ